MTSNSDELTDYLSSIVAVHGLGAHPEFTWTVLNKQIQLLQAQSSSNADHVSDKHRVNWLKDDGFLKDDFKKARIMTFGYNADWFVGAPMATAEQRAGTMLRELKRKRADVEVRYLLLQYNTVLTTLREYDQYYSSDIALAALS